MVVERKFYQSFELDSEQEDSSLADRAVKGGMWIFLLKVIRRGLGLIRTIILARLLSPDDFGLFGVALLTINLLENFSVTGIKTALVQKKQNIKNYLDTAWTISLIRAGILFSLLYFGAPLVAYFFKSPRALDVVKALAFFQLIVGFENIGTIYFQKEIRFDRVVFLTFSGVIVNVSVSIIMAFILRNVWALVWGSLCGTFIKTVMSYMLHPYRPKLKFDVEKAKELLHFGKWIFGSSILVFLITQGDDAFVGRILGIAALGLYQMAYNLSNIPATEISNFVSQITFPVYSKMQDNISRLRDAYLKVLQLVSFFSFPIAGFIFILAPDFTKLFLGEKWMPMVPAMKMLTLWGLIRSIGTTTTQVFYAVGKPNIPTKIKFSQLLLIIAFIYPLTIRWGILGASLTIVAATFLPNLVACYKTVRIIQSSVFDFSKRLLLPLVNTLITLAVIFESKVWLQGSMMFFINIFIGLLVYICVTILFNRFLNYDMWFVLRKIRKGLGH